MLQGLLSVVKDEREKKPCALQKAALQCSFAMTCIFSTLDQMESAIKTKFVTVQGSLRSKVELKRRRLVRF